MMKPGGAQLDEAVLGIPRVKSIGETGNFGLYAYETWT